MAEDGGDVAADEVEEAVVAVGVGQCGQFLGEGAGGGGGVGGGVASAGAGGEVAQ